MNKWTIPFKFEHFITIYKHIGKRLSQLYEIKTKIYYGQFYIDVRVVIATKCRHQLFLLKP